MIKFLILSLLALSACEDSNSKQARQQETILMKASDEIGMPAIVNFQERKMLKQIFELRDQSISTTTYIVDLNGGLHKMCDSVGYGVSSATQFTSPSYLSVGGHTMPQADPNGLFSPASAEGTWVNCLNPVTKQLAVVYIEPRVIVSPFPLTVR